MSRTKNYQHFCPVARALEVIGEKWSLLVVRDLLRGPQRFTDLLRYLGGITPKWLSLRLQELEREGIIERDSEPGRREVWYRLTPKGRDLSPVIEALNVWGIDYALRAPRPGEPINPEQTLYAVTTYLNKRGWRLPRKTRWLLRFSEKEHGQMIFDGRRWSAHRGEGPADLVIDTSPEEWVGFIIAARGDRRRLGGRLRLQGGPERVNEFMETFAAGHREPQRPREPSGLAKPLQRDGRQ